MRGTNVTAAKGSKGIWREPSEKEQDPSRSKMEGGAKTQKRRASVYLGKGWAGKATETERGRARGGDVRGCRAERLRRGSGW